MHIMTDEKPVLLDVELEALRTRSAELIAEVVRINERMDQLTAKVKQAPSEPAITDTWVEPMPGVKGDRSDP
jgi:uncharacterized protein with PhoU and TrkA domain